MPPKQKFQFFFSHLHEGNEEKYTPAWFSSAVEKRPPLNNKRNEEVYRSSNPFIKLIFAFSIGESKRETSLKRGLYHGFVMK